MATFTEHLRARGEPGLTALLAARPDLAAPPPSSVRSLSARAANRSSLDRALAGVDALVLAAVESVLALDGVAGSRGATAADVAHATGTDPARTGPPVRTAVELALLWTEEPLPEDLLPDDLGDVVLHPAPGLDDVLGPYPAGLGPRLVDALGRRSPQAHERLAQELGLDVPAPPTDDDTPSRAEVEADVVARLAARLADPAVVTELLSRAPSGAGAVLAALTWGPPVGRSPVPAPGQESSPGRTAVEWLLRHGLLSVGDSQHVVLPREVALALRDGRTHRDVTVHPEPDGIAVDPRTVDAESAREAENAVRLAGALVTVWGADPPPVLRSGGLGSRELRRAATRMDVPDELAALVVEVAGAAGLVADDGDDPPAIVPTTDADDWLRRDVAARWQTLAEAWLLADRAAWLVGTRDERGSLRSALDPELRRPWAPRLRRSVLDVLAGSPPDHPRALAAAAVHEVLQWRTPRAAPPLHAVEAVLREAGALGVLGAGALSPAGRALLAGATDDGLTPADALTAQLPPPVDEVLLQGDLTGVVPGRPSTELAALLDAAAQVESRGAGLTVRFTDMSVRNALDAGRTAEELLAELSRHARSGVPQPLEYLVLDAARRHGRVRVGLASSYLRADDPALLTGLVEDRGLRDLGLLRLAPTVIAAQAPPAVLLAALRERGLAPVTEDPSGTVVVAAVTARRVRVSRSRRGLRTTDDLAAQADDARERRLRRLAKDLLSADRAETAALGAAGVRTGPATAETGRAPTAGSSAPDARTGSAGRIEEGVGEGTPDPVLALALLREAAAEGREVWIEIVGSAGSSTRRRVRPLRVDAGRVRAIDPEREAELTVAVHRIASVTPA